MKSKAKPENLLYTNQALRKLIIPLVIEQILILSVGMADTIMISGVGEAAVSGVSLVDNINVLIINIFTAMATGGAVVAGHFLGQKDSENACKSAWQLMIFSSITSIIISIFLMAGHQFILITVFGKIEMNVMENAKTYLMITAISIFPLAIYNGCAALFRAMGNSKVTMWISLAMNLLNICGNALLIYVFKMGVAGAAISTTLSRIFGTVLIFAFLYKEKYMIHFKGYITWRIRKGMIKRILYIGIPNGLENSMFQLGKILLLSLVASFGTSAIAANAVSGTVTMINILPGNAIGFAQLSVVSMCIGAGEMGQAKYFTKKLMKITNLCIAGLSVIIFFGAKYILIPYQLSPETQSLTVWILRYHAIMAVLFWVPSFSFNNSLRAAGDVFYSMITAGISMWIFRIVTAYVLGWYFQMGLKGVWIAMTIDWIFRGICFTIRFESGKWLTKIRKLE